MPPYSGFWREECPERGPGLSHAHWRECLPSETHPSTDVTHRGDQCCHCELSSLNYIETRDLVEPNADVEMREAGVKPVRADHAYRWTIGGRCGQENCGRHEDDHPLILPRPSGDGCLIDHKSLNSRLLIGDKGMEWNRCPSCTDLVEPRLATGIPVGAPWGPGRSVITGRQQFRLEFIKYMADAGRPVGREQ